MSALISILQPQQQYLPPASPQEKYLPPAEPTAHSLPAPAPAPAVSLHK